MLTSTSPIISCTAVDAVSRTDMMAGGGDLDSSELSSVFSFSLSKLGNSGTSLK